MRGRKVIVKQDLYTKTGKKKRLNMGEVVRITSNEVDENNCVSVTSTMRYYPIHNVPLDILELQ